MQKNRFQWLTGVLYAIVLMMTLMLPAHADKADLSAMTDDEVLSLLDMVNQEIVSRGIQKTADLPKGAYIVGQDIPAGTYVYTSQAKGDEWGSVTVYSDGGSGKLLLWEIVSAPENGEEQDKIYGYTAQFGGSICGAFRSICGLQKSRLPSR